MLDTFLTKVLQNWISDDSRLLYSLAATMDGLGIRNLTYVAKDSYQASGKVNINLAKPIVQNKALDFPQHIAADQQSRREHQIKRT